MMQVLFTVLYLVGSTGVCVAFRVVQSFWHDPVALLAFLDFTYF